MLPGYPFYAPECFFNAWRLHFDAWRLHLAPVFCWPPAVFIDLECVFLCELIRNMRFDKCKIRVSIRSFWYAEYRPETMRKR